VDQGLAPLLELLWANGYDTQYSCEGGLEPGSRSQQGGMAQPSVFKEMIFDGTNFVPDPSPGVSDAHCIFASYEDGCAFLRYSCIRMGWPGTSDLDFYDDVLWCDMLILQAIPPLKGSGTQPRANVYWPSHLTKKLIEVWSAPAQADQVG
jgi:hypothetical protein